MRNSFVFNARVYKNASLWKLVLKPKSWILIPKDFEFLDIFIESKWGYSPIYIYVLKLMESKVKEDINCVCK